MRTSSGLRRVCHRGLGVSLKNYLTLFQILEIKQKYKWELQQTMQFFFNFLVLLVIQSKDDTICIFTARGKNGKNSVE